MKRSIEWAAGLFEGEGCIDIRRPRYGVATRLQLSSTDFDVIQDYADTLELKVSGPYANGANRKPIYHAGTAKKSEVQRILSLLLPHLGSRRAYKALNALDVIECNLSPEECLTL